MQTIVRTLDRNASEPPAACLPLRSGLLGTRGGSDAPAALSRSVMAAILHVFAGRSGVRGRRRPLDLSALILLTSGLAPGAGIRALRRLDSGVEGALKPTGATASAAAAAGRWLSLPRMLALLGPADRAATASAVPRGLSGGGGATVGAKAGEGRFAGSSEHLANGLFVLRADAGGRRVFGAVNPSFAALRGLPHERTEGARVADALAAPEAVAELKVAVVACFSSGRAQDWESPDGVGLGGRRRHAALVPLPSDSASEGSRLLLGSLPDVTDVRRRQAVLPCLETARDAVAERPRRCAAAPACITLAADPGAATVQVLLRDSAGAVTTGLAPCILDPFVTTKDPGRGSGRGLPTATGVARVLGRSLGWSNQGEGRPDAGAAFRRLCRPLRPASPAAERAA
jgi:hypothetical protein